MLPRSRHHIRAAAALAVAVALFAPATASAGVDASAVRAYRDHVSNAWTAHQLADGSIGDPLQPSSRSISYGTVMLADTIPRSRHAPPSRDFLTACDNAPNR
jgi:hypothetical protein